ncbi:MAG: UbiA family prenyltransferase [Crocinitomicaceae bacterium]|nr:UbiA family prenyltransferase [Crocinitomicaceae bacterium]
MFSLQTKLIAALNFLIYSNIWIALAAVSLNLYFYRLTQQEPDWLVCAFVFSATLFIYNFQRIVKLRTATAFSGDRLIWIKRNFLLSNLLTIIGLLLSLFLFFLLETRTVFLLIPIGIVALFYVGKFLLKNVGGFRDIPFLKVYFVSISWVSVSVMLPLLNSHEDLTETVWITGASVFLLVFSIAIIFDLRDANMDEKAKRTVPQLVGKNWTILIAIMALFLSMIFPVLIDASNWTIALPVIVLGTILIVNASEEKSDFYFSFYLDGILILPGLICLLL